MDMDKKATMIFGIGIWVFCSIGLICLCIDSMYSNSLIAHQKSCTGQVILKYFSDEKTKVEALKACAPIDEGIV